MECYKLCYQSVEKQACNVNPRSNIRCPRALVVFMWMKNSMIVYQTCDRLAGSPRRNVTASSATSYVTVATWETARPGFLAPPRRRRYVSLLQPICVASVYSGETQHRNQWMPERLVRPGARVASYRIDENIDLRRDQATLYVIRTVKFQYTAGVRITYRLRQACRLLARTARSLTCLLVCSLSLLSSEDLVADSPERGGDEA